MPQRRDRSRARKVSAAAKAGTPRSKRVPGKAAIAKRAPAAAARGLAMPPKRSGRGMTLDARSVLEPARDGIASTRDHVAKLNDDEARSLALACRDAASAKKGEDVLMLDIRAKAAFADFFILATGRS